MSLRAVKSGEQRQSGLVKCSDGGVNGGVRWDRDICPTTKLTGALSIWRNDARMRGEPGKLLPCFDTSGV